MDLNKVFTLGAVAVVVFAIAQNLPENTAPAANMEPVTPNWAAIAAWPSTDAAVVEAQPDPNMRVTAIILDDSGSMGSDIVPAKRAVIDAMAAMAPDDRVAVLALNAGTILPFTSVSDARAALPGRLAPIGSDGSTPLTRSIGSAMALLEDEAATLRGFGTYRLIVTTDGDADDGNALVGAIETLASRTPIQLTTIGIGIRGGHVLRRADLGSFVDVANVGALAEALQAAVAENTDFTAITDFDATGG
ncbi:MAG: vWA domain-containing protein [Pseudomonadota bacterium]